MSRSPCSQQPAAWPSNQPTVSNGHPFRAPAGSRVWRGQERSILGQHGAAPSARHTHPGPAGTQAHSPGPGAQHRLPWHQPALEVFPSVPSVAQGTPPCLTLRPKSSLLPGASPPITCAGAEGPVGRPLQACHPSIHSVQTQLGLVSASQTPGRAPPAAPGPAGRTCVAQKGTTALPGSCGPLVTTGTPEECSICAPIKRPAVKTEPQWAGDGEGKSGLTTPRDSDTVSTESQGTCRRLAASWGAWPLHPGPGTRDSWGARTGPCLGRTFSAQERVLGHSRAGHVPAEVPSPPASSFLLQLETGPAYRGHGHPSPRHTLPAREKGLKVPRRC